MQRIGVDALYKFKFYLRQWRCSCANKKNRLDIFSPLQSVNHFLYSMPRMHLRPP